jgi:hypothetical protein
VLIDRQTFEQVKLEKVNPFDALTNFRHEVNFVKTRGFNPVEELTL